MDLRLLAAGEYPAAETRSWAGAPPLRILRADGVAKDDFLPPEQAYKYSARVEGDQLIVSWKIEKGYYLYKKKMAVASTMATVQLGRRRSGRKAKNTATSTSASRRSIAAPSKFRSAIEPHAESVSQARLRAEAARMRGCGPVLSAADLEDEAALDSSRPKRPATTAEVSSAFKTRPGGRQQRRLPAAR